MTEMCSTKQILRQVPVENKTCYRNTIIKTQFSVNQKMESDNVKLYGTEEYS